MFWAILVCIAMGIIGGTAPIWWDAISNKDHIHQFGEKYEEVPGVWVRKCKHCIKVKYYY